MDIINWVDAKADDFILFQHIPKTAGTAVSSGLHTYLGGPNYLWYHGPVGPTKELMSELPFKGVGGHYYNYYFNDYPNDRRLVYLTILREPIDRVISQYYYLKVASDHVIHPYCVEYSLRDLLLLDLPECSSHFNNVQVEMISFDKDPNNSLSSAKASIDKYTFFGLQSRMKELEGLLACLFDDPGFKITFFDANKTRPSWDKITPETIEIIKEYNQEDIEFYNYAVELYNTKYYTEWLPKCR